MAMVRKIGSAKDHHAIEHRQNLGFASSHVAVPQLQMTAVILPPILVQIEQEIQPSIETKVVMFIKIYVNA